MHCYSGAWLWRSYFRSGTVVMPKFRDSSKNYELYIARLVSDIRGIQLQIISFEGFYNYELEILGRQIRICPILPSCADGDWGVSSIASLPYSYLIVWVNLALSLIKKITMSKEQERQLRSIKDQQLAKLIQRFDTIPPSRETPHH